MPSPSLARLLPPLSQPSFTTELPAHQTFASTLLPADGDTGRAFEAQLPPPEILGGFVGLTCLLAATTLFWWNVVIPQQRSRLAISKSRGEVNEMLQRLEETDPEEASPQISAQKWLFADWLEQRRRRRTKPAAIPFLKKAKWNSGDNPVLVAFAGVMSLVLMSVLAERLSK